MPKASDSTGLRWRVRRLAGLHGRLQGDPSSHPHSTPQELESPQYQSSKSPTKQEACNNGLLFCRGGGGGGESDSITRTIVFGPEGGPGAGGGGGGGAWEMVGLTVRSTPIWGIPQKAHQYIEYE